MKATGFMLNLKGKGLRQNIKKIVRITCIFEEKNKIKPLFCQQKSDTSEFRDCGHVLESDYDIISGGGQVLVQRYGRETVFNEDFKIKSLFNRLFHKIIWKLFKTEL